ncbi:MAG: DNA polymerase III subunit delta [Pirellulaceae bacterium]
MATIHVLDYLAAPQGHQPRGICVLFGDEQFLKRLALAEIRKQALGDKSDEPPTVHDCEERMPDWRDVADELSTQSLFGGGGPRLVLLEGADAFVSAHREDGRLEDYVNKKKHAGLLILEVSSWASNTRLYKAVDAASLQIECRPPMRPRPRSKEKEIDEAKVSKWVSQWAKTNHGLDVPHLAAQELVGLSGANFGMMDMDLAKLALLVTPGTKITPQYVHDVIGGWREKTAFETVNAALDGDTALALERLDHLWKSGDHHLEIFGGMSWSLRRYAAATRAFEQAERRGQKVSLENVLRKVGFYDRSPDDNVEKAGERMKKLGRIRAGKLYKWVMETDLALKGTHSDKDRARFVLEQLFLRMATEATPPPKSPVRR